MEPKRIYLIVTIYNMLPKIVAVYGTLKKGYGNHRLIQDSEYLGEDLVPFLALNGGGFPIAKFPVIEDAERAENFYNNPDQNLIKIELYKVEDEMTLRSLDALEGHPRRYLRQPIITQKGVACEIYSMNTMQDGDIKEVRKDSENIYSFKRI